jgi:hypothetical protein
MRPMGQMDMMTEQYSWNVYNLTRDFDRTESTIQFMAAQCVVTSNKAI